MATFTHTVQWSFLIDGRAQAFSFSYEVEDVYDVQVKRCDSRVTMAFREEPDYMAALIYNDTARVIIGDNTGPTLIPARYAEKGDVVAYHKSETGGTWNSTASNSTSTLLENDNIGASSAYGTVRHNVGVDVLALYKAAS